jgi:sulfatase modifying factor 1
MATRSDVGRGLGYGGAVRAPWWLVGGVIAVSGGLGCEPVVGADWEKYLGEGATSTSAGSGGQGGQGGQGGEDGQSGQGGQGGSWNPGNCVGELGYAPPSCQGANSGQDDCGPSGDESCCVSHCVQGGTFNRSNAPESPASISSFRLDRFEVTVGRFRVFVEAGMGTQLIPPAEAAGERAKLPESGWHGDAWNGILAATTADLEAQLTTSIDTWSGGDDRRPINEVNWFEAFAFCVWDGGFLPTEAEWNYAATGGAEQRPYPWGTPEPDSSRVVYAVYDQTYVLSSIARVGSKPAGEGRWGQLDLAGNLWEWTLDWYATYASPCTDCAQLQTADYRVLRGGGFFSDASYLHSGVRHGSGPSFRNDGRGFRCARTP